MYIPGRLRTASRPSRTWIELASYPPFVDALAEGASIGAWFCSLSTTKGCPLRCCADERLRPPEAPGQFTPGAQVPVYPAGLAKVGCGGHQPRCAPRTRGLACPPMRGGGFGGSARHSAVLRGTLLDQSAVRVSRPVALHPKPPSLPGRSRRTLDV